jgi:hypothetical protein
MRVTWAWLALYALLSRQTESESTASHPVVSKQMRHANKSPDFVQPTMLQLWQRKNIDPRTVVCIDMISCSLETPPPTYLHVHVCLAL